MAEKTERGMAMDCRDKAVVRSVRFSTSPDTMKNNRNVIARNIDFVNE